VEDDREPAGIGGGEGGVSSGFAMDPEADYAALTTDDTEQNAVAPEAPVDSQTPTTTYDQEYIAKLQAGFQDTTQILQRQLQETQQRLAQVQQQVQQTGYPAQRQARPLLDPRQFPEVDPDSLDVLNQVIPAVMAPLQQELAQLKAEQAARYSAQLEEAGATEAEELVKAHPELLDATGPQARLSPQGQQFWDGYEQLCTQLGHDLPLEVAHAYLFRDTATAAAAQAAEQKLAMSIRSKQGRQTMPSGGGVTHIEKLEIGPNKWGNAAEYKRKFLGVARGGSA
jgi:hypothetical protein